MVVLLKLGQTTKTILHSRDKSVKLGLEHTLRKMPKNTEVRKYFWNIVPLPTELAGTAARFFYHWGRQLKSQQNEGICGSPERSEVLLDLLSAMLTLQLAPEAVNKSDLIRLKKNKRYFLK